MASTGSGFSFGLATQNKGFSGFGATSTTQSTATPQTGFNFSGTTSTPGAGLSLGTPATKPFAAVSATTSTTTSAPTLGFNLSTPASTAAASTGLALNLSTTAKPAFNLPAATTTTLATSAANASTLGAVFTNTPAAKVATGLGGIDPKTTSFTSGNGGNSGKPSDSKAVKETTIPNVVGTTVESFKKYVKSQKSVREDIARMSAKQISKVQEDMISLRQLLSVVSNGLQRNAGVIEKLKMDVAQEVKHVEIAQRTKDTPPGLQYENTAPLLYFQKLVEDFEVRMQIYRQQIDNIESHFATLNQPGFVSPQDLTMLLRKLHETFIALAAQLQVIHDAVKTQKEHYLNYRKVFHGDTNNVFETRKITAEKIGQKPMVRVGPTPFTGISNAAAVAMASALNRGQQPPAPQTGAAPPTIGLNTGFGTQQGTQPSQFGTTGFGGLGFGQTTTAASTGFGFGTTTATPAAGGFNFGTPATAPTLGGFGQTNTGFQLQKPPTGTKRGKKT